MSSGFEGTKGPARVSVAQAFVTDEGGTLAVSFPGWHHAIEVYAHATDGSMAIGEANAGLVAEAFNVLHETGLTPRQLAEERARLLEAAQRVIAHRIGDLPNRGDLRDNDASRRDLAALAQVIATQRKEPGA